MNKKSVIIRRVGRASSQDRLPCSKTVQTISQLTCRVSIQLFTELVTGEL
jgi:hypothetical protein